MKVYKYPRELSIAVLVAAQLFSAEKLQKPVIHQLSSSTLTDRH